MIHQQATPAIPKPAAATLLQSKARVKFTEPEAHTYKWADAMRPEYGGKPVADKELDEWLISVIATYRSSSEDQNYCIIGSRVLQRILQERYGLNPQDLYITNDTDIWIKDRASLIDLVHYLTQRVKLKGGAYELLPFNEMHLFEQGIYLYSFHVKKKTKPGEEPGSISTIDISTPLTNKDVSTDNGPTPPKTQTAMTAATHRLEHFIGKAQPLPMGYQSLLSVCPQTLTDNDYLNSINEALNNPDCSDETYSKLQNTVALLMYIEVTRRLYKKQPVDGFTKRLIEIVCAHLPETHRQIKRRLPNIVGSWGLEQLPRCLFQPLATPRPRKSAVTTLQQSTSGTVHSEAHSRPSKAIPIVNPNPQDTDKPCSGKCSDLVTDHALPQKHQQEKKENKGSSPSQAKNSQPRKRKKKKHSDAPQVSQPLTTEIIVPLVTEAKKPDHSEKALSHEKTLLISDKISKEPDYSRQLAILAEEGATLEQLQEKASTNFAVGALLTLLNEPEPEAEPEQKKTATNFPSVIPTEIEKQQPQTLTVSKAQPTEQSDSQSPENKETDSLEDTVSTPPSDQSSGSSATVKSDDKFSPKPEKSAKSAKVTKADSQMLKQLNKIVPLDTLVPSPPHVYTESQLTDYLITGTLPSGAESTQRIKSPELRQIIWLKKLLSELGSTCHSGLLGWGEHSVIELRRYPVDKEYRLRKVEGKTFTDCPYADYLEAVICLNDSKSPVKHAHATRKLIRAASAGVTGAAIELIRQSLEQEAFPVPGYVAMQMLKQCLDRPKDQQYPLRFRAAPLRLPLSAAEQVITLFEKNIKHPMTPALWEMLGEQLSQTTLSAPKTEERCLLFASCAYSIADKPKKVRKCRSQNHQKQCTLSKVHELDWFMVSVASRLQASSNPSLTASLAKEITSYPQLKEWPPALALQQALLSSSDGLHRAFTTLQEDPDFVAENWITLLPYCLPVHHPLDWIGKNKLRLYWRQTLTLRLQTAPQKATNQPAIAIDASTQKPLSPLQAEVFNTPEQARQEGEVMRELDSILEKEIQACVSGVRQETESTSATESGCRFTAQALHILGLTSKDSNLPQCMNPDFPIRHPQKYTEAVERLTKAIEHYANPYACWVYARILRGQLIQGLGTEQGKQDWYNKYLSLMLFAANMGVTGAGNDLLSETLAGRADGLLTSTVALISQRARQPQRFQLNLKLPPLSTSTLLDAIKQYKESPTHSSAATSQGKVPKSQIMREIEVHQGVTLRCEAFRSAKARPAFEPGQSPWKDYLQEKADGLLQESMQETDPVHTLRLSWIAQLFQSFIHPDGIAKAVLPSGKDKQDSPPELQVSITASLEFLESALTDQYDSLVNKDFSAFPLLCALKEARTAPAKAFVPNNSGHLLPWLQWQPGTDSIVAINQQLKKHKSLPPDACHHITAHGQLMSLLWCTTIATLQSELALVRSESCLQSITPMLNFYQSMDTNERVVYMQPSPELKTVKQTLQQLDSILIAERSLKNTDKEPVPPKSAYIMSMLATQEQTRFYVDSLARIEVARSTLFCLQALEDTCPSDPYPYLIEGLCLENRQEGKTSPQDTAQAGAMFMRAAMLGSDSAAWHMARLALVVEGSPISMERVLDMFLLQYQRALTHSLHFICRTKNVCNQEQNLILQVLENVCLNNQSPKQDVSKLILDKLIPGLCELSPQIQSPVTQSQLDLLISCCYLKINKNMSRVSFSITSDTMAELPISLIHSWKYHITSTHRALKESSETLATCLQPILDHTNSRQGQIIPYRRVPDLIGDELRSVEQWQPFHDWHTRKNSWYELPAMMGENELDHWTANYCNLQYSHLFPEPVVVATLSTASTPQKIPGLRAVSCTLPGIKTEEYYEITLYQSFVKSLVNGTPLHFPVPKTTNQKAKAQFWYDQYCIACGNAFMEPVAFSDTASASAVAPDTMFRKPKKKKKKTVPPSTSQTDI